MTKLESLLEDLEKGISRLEEITRQEKSMMVRDAAIQRFEFTFELAWKSLKAYLEEYHNTRGYSPKQCFREAYNKEILEYDEYWLKIADLRNLIAHSYKEEAAEEIYEQIPQILKYFQYLLKEMKRTE
ncbi:MAG: HI0074 family nucleotidyltransferase substrate-binding subunit [Patescibacteria group bacterium]